MCSGIVSLIPKSALLLGITESYGPLKEKIPCGLAGCRTPHARGFLVTFQDHNGAKAVGRLGRVCGRNNFRTSWTDVNVAFTKKQHAMRVDDARKRFSSRLGKLLPGLDRLAPVVAEVMSVRLALGEVIGASSDAARSRNGVIDVYRRDGMASRHKLEGLPFWLTGNELADRVAALRSDCMRLRDYLSRPDVDLREVERRLHALADVPHRWGMIKKGVESAYAALDVTHMASLLATLNMVAVQAPDRFWGSPANRPEWRLGVRLRGPMLETRAPVRERLEGESQDVWLEKVDLQEFGLQLQAASAEMVKL